MKLLVVCAVLIGLSGCTFLTKEGKGVVFTKNKERIANCEFVGDVESKNLILGGPGGRNKAINAAKNKTADLGGDTLYLTIYDTDGIGTNVTGEAYKCRK